MKKILYTLLLAAALPIVSYAQSTVTPYTGKVEVAFPNYTMQGSNVTFRASVDYSYLQLKSRQMIELTPILRSTRGSHEVRFAPVVVSGKQRARVIARSEYFNDYQRAIEPAEIIVLKRNSPRTYEVAVTVPFEKWMRYSELVLVETCTACCNLLQEYGAGITSKTYVSKEPYVFPAPFKPAFAVSYMAPEVEPIKVNSDTHSAQLNFQVNRSNLLPEYGNNAAVLAGVDKVIGEIKNDPLFTIKSITIKGYASPEGNANSNFNLSRDRAQAMVTYLTTRHKFNPSDRVLTSNGMGEDWDGLRKLIAESSLDEKQSILDAIDNNSDVNRRKTAIRNLNGGRTYKMLLENYYPQLRRNEYTVSYEVRGFNAEEARQYVWTRPNLLSLNEFFMVSRLYDPKSKEYKEIFDIAARMYRNSELAQFNTAAMEVENGSYDKAIARLEKIDNAESWNNLAVAYWHKGEYSKAREYFQKAADKGLETAAKNLEQYKLWFADRDE